jgi:phosphoribosylamine--glycine ligase
MASGGYPGKYHTGFPISGLDKLGDDIMVFHSGTKTDGNSRIITDGGRVLTVVAAGKTITEARDKVYQNLPIINFANCYYRKDIAAREVN